jgi:hypothetical protein
MITTLLSLLTKFFHIPSDQITILQILSDPYGKSNTIKTESMAVMTIYGREFVFRLDNQYRKNMTYDEFINTMPCGSPTDYFVDFINNETLKRKLEMLL